MENLKSWIQQHNELKEELITMRRYLHEHAEVGSNLPMTKQYIVEKLISYGYHPKCHHGGSIEVIAGKPNHKTILLRADMDALPIEEKSDVFFRCTNGNMHACGHDLHSAIMLGCAKLLKENELDLKGQVKIVFQPHEEGLVGCERMIEDGILQSPNVDAALGLHVLLGSHDPSGTIRIISGEMCSSSTIFEIHVKGKQAHGSKPEEGIDALRTAVHIYQTLQEIIPKEIAMDHANVLTIGMLQAGVSHNVIPDHAYMKCSLRSYQDKDQKYIMKRIHEIVENVAQIYHASATVNILQHAPCVYNDKVMVSNIFHTQKIFMKHYLMALEKPLSVSEDFAHISQRVPSVFATLSAGRIEDGYIYGHHHEQAIFDESCMLYGVYFLYTTAIQYLLQDM